ncbi:hypothetical protein E2C01_090332 [Portunus trituberculatus]|uniref:Uncharacterized protein n=1 Tax=Portunus trituberculatus TaxID=210409 RepID=A0A5B7JLK2_PORTR|nr:hypothetical protein [Portunus trituberculatus]
MVLVDRRGVVRVQGGSGITDEDTVVLRGSGVGGVVLRQGTNIGEVLYPVSCAITRDSSSSSSSSSRRRRVSLRLELGVLQVFQTTSRVNDVVKT